MTIKEIIDRNYAAQIKRGQITTKSDIDTFWWKIDSELHELADSVTLMKPNEFDPKELADIILVCLSMSKHYNIDIVKVLEEKTLYNETRKD